MTRQQTDFDAVARPYRWLEYLTLGRSLERCRLYFLPQVATQTEVLRHVPKALVLGDGDGRFLSRLFAACPRLTADAVDTSATMLELLRSRCEQTSGTTGRFEIHQADALAFVQTRPASTKYDLVVTHFFLDCLAQSEVETLALHIGPLLVPNSLWLVSDFRIPQGLMRLPARIIVRTLYLVFRLLTGLRPNRLPDHAAALARAGLQRIAHCEALAGLLFTELWVVQPDSEQRR